VVGLVKFVAPHEGWLGGACDEGEAGKKREVERANFHGFTT
jgi:hypothetical protein